MATASLANITIKGIDKTVARFSKIEADLSRERVATVAKEYAEIVAQEARMLAPLGHDPYDTHPGRLIGSIRARLKGTIGSVTAGGSNIPYAGPIHWGWPAHHISPNKFLTKALYNVEVPFEKRYAHIVDEAVNG